MSRRSGIACVLLVLSITTLHAQSPTPQQVEFFESKVRPILVENCYECHSVDSDEIEGGLVLDSKWGWQSGGDSGPAIAPGNIDESLLIAAIGYEEDIVSGMPPKSKLSDKQISILEQWVKMGAPDPRPKATPHGKSSIEVFDLKQRFDQHWSWRPIAEHEPPSVKNESWPRNDIDRFVLSKIEEAGLRPAAVADKRTWLRRVYFDLIGLPPTREQISQFLADQSPQAHSHIVAQLLDSPHFGEKWARHWMDLVRYAETYGHEFDYELRHAHQYRDYLIRAFNADVPFDQFVREHIAGDLIAEPRRHPEEDFNESIIGTGFWYLHEATHAPTDVLGNEADIVDNQLDVFGKAFLGLTVACARCHDHKFDAISTADYYALSAYLQSSCRQEISLDPGRRVEASTREVDRLRNQAAGQLRSIDSETALRLRPGVYYEVATRLNRRASREQDVKEVPSQWISPAASKHGLEHSRLRQWVREADNVATTTVETDAKDPSVLFAGFDDGQLPQGWSTSGFAFHPIGQALTLSVDSVMAPSGTIDSGLSGKKQTGILRSPTFEITTRQIHVRMKATANITVQVIIDNYHMAHYNKLLFKGTFVNGKDSDTKGQWVWKSLGGDLRKYIGHKAFLEIVDNSDGSIAIDEIRFSDGPPPRRNGVSDSKSHAAYIDQLWRDGIGDLRSGRPNKFIASMMETGLLRVEELSKNAGDSLAEANRIALRLPAPRFVVAMAQGTPEQAHVYIRGSHANLGRQVPARFLEAFGGKQASRLELANLIASPENPLTARAIVNRLWHHLLGRGIVPTVDDLGPQGQRPSHGELLDWLARDLIDNGWSLKHVIGHIVLSQTYRQSSVAHADLDPELIATTDPTNALLYRMRVRRLQSESIRDAILLVSGRLDPKPFGPSVATHRTPFMTGRGARPSGPLDGDGRRSIYLSVYRNFLNPFLLTFDMPSPFGPQGRRSRSNVPAQALTLMNDPLVIGQAGVWADVIVSDAQRTDRERIAEMVEQAHGVVATEDEITRLQNFLTQQSEIHGKLDQRAWSDLGHALLNMKAFYFLR